jgi:glutathione S-transferase
MRLHVVVGSPNSRKVLAVVDHLGIDLDIEYHDFFDGELRGAPYRALNPNGKVPVLEDGGFVLWESNAINQYLADQAGSDALFPRSAALRADVTRWQCWELAHFNKAFGVLAFESVAKPRHGLGAANPALVEASQGDLRRYAAVLETHLATHRYAVGDAITIADYALIHLEGFQQAVPFDWTPYPSLNGYFARMRAVEHWTRTAPPSPEAVGRKPQAA